MRTPQDLVSDMLQRGRDWSAILCLARCTRRGSWYNDVKQILLKRQLMPSNESEIAQIRDGIIKRQRQEQMIYLKQAEIEKKKKRQRGKDPAKIDHMVVAMALARIRPHSRRKLNMSNTKAVEKPTEVTEKKPQIKSKSEFATKVTSMTMEQIISWAREVGVPDEKITQHKDKPLGLAKMNLSNLIRSRLKS